MGSIQISDDFALALAQLGKLSRNHLLFFRLEVGSLLLGQFFGGDAAAYHSTDPDKPQSFSAFSKACAEQLADIGLSDTVLRQSIVAHIVVQALPPAAAEKLAFTQIVELTKVSDAATRAVLALASVDNQWTTRELRGAVQAQKAGRWIDAKPQEPGLQAPAAAEPAAPPKYSAEHPPQAGRVVVRLERVVQELAQVVDDWALVDAAKATDAQKARVKTAVAGLLARLGPVG